ncbi:MAG: TPM domain-containing protein, partial [Verrucomicrobiaceae bacterium]
MTVSWHRPVWLTFLLVWLVSWTAVVAEEALPASPTPHYIRDDVGWLSPVGFRTLDAKLMAFERETSSQFVVAIFPQVPEGAELFDFSQRLYQSWKPGGAKEDNGAIFLIFANDRKLRIHTGYGMEGVLPDARCKQIISDVVVPLMRQGNYEAAVNAGVDAMIASAKGEYKGTGKTRLDGESGESSWSPLLIILLLAGGFVTWGIWAGWFTLADVIFTMLGSSRSSGGGGWSSGGG